MSTPIRQTVLHIRCKAGSDDDLEQPLLSSIETNHQSRISKACISLYQPVPDQATTERSLKQGLVCLSQQQVKIQQQPVADIGDSPEQDHESDDRLEQSDTGGECKYGRTTQDGHTGEGNCCNGRAGVGPHVGEKEATECGLGWEHREKAGVCCRQGNEPELPDCDGHDRGKHEPAECDDEPGNDAKRPAELPERHQHSQKHDGLIVASHRAQDTDAIITTDSAIDDTGYRTVWA